MAVESTDIEVRLSSPAATEGDATAQADPNASLGEFMSTTAMTAATKGNLFRATTAAEGGTGVVLYRCIFFTNTHATDTAEGCRVYIPSQSAGGANVTIGLDPAGVVAGDLGTAQAAVIASETDAPTGVTFSAPSSFEDGLVVGDIAPGEAIGIWIKETVPTNADAKDEDAVLVELAGVSDG